MSFEPFWRRTCHVAQALLPVWFCGFMAIRRLDVWENRTGKSACATFSLRKDRFDHRIGRARTPKACRPFAQSVQ